MEANSYLVDVSVRPAADPLDQLEILLRVPPRQVQVHGDRPRGGPSPVLPRKALGLGGETPKTQLGPLGTYLTGAPSHFNMSVWATERMRTATRSLPALLGLLEAAFQNVLRALRSLRALT